MGYYMTQRDAIFNIKAEDVEKALAAIKKLADPEKMKLSASGGGTVNGKPVIHYSWVTNNEFLEANTLQDAIIAWRWNIGLDRETGDVCEIFFEGEKLGDDEALFKALAPYVEDGSYIEMSGEEGALWRWEFNNGEVEEKFATVRWD